MACSAKGGAVYSDSTLTLALGNRNAAGKSLYNHGLTLITVHSQDNKLEHPGYVRGAYVL